MENWKGNAVSKWWWWRRCSSCKSPIITKKKLCPRNSTQLVISAQFMAVMWMKVNGMEWDKKEKKASPLLLSIGYGIEWMCRGGGGRSFRCLVQVKYSQVGRHINNNWLFIAMLFGGRTLRKFTPSNEFPEYLLKKEEDEKSVRRFFYCLIELGARPI